MNKEDNISQAISILQQVDTVAAVGPRALSLRVLPKAILSLALSVGSFMIPAVIGLAVGHQALDQGVVAQMAGASHIYEDIKPAQAATIYRSDTVHPLLQAGMDTDGFISKDRLFSAWSAAGIDEATASRLIIRLWAAGAVVAPASGLPKDIASHRFDADALSEMNLPAASTMGYEVGQLVPEWMEASRMYETASHHLGFGETAAGFAKTAGDVSPSEAREHLLRAVEEAGLASYSVPLDAMVSPRAMYGHADALMQLNAELAEISGWEGQVAGLGGRVHWVPAAETGALATTSRAGSSVLIKGAASAYGHEFIHGIDFVIAQSALVGNHRLPLSDDSGPLRLVQDKAISTAHHDHIRHLREVMPGFHARVDAFKDRSLLSFMPDEAPISSSLRLTTQSEIIARSFEMYVGNMALQSPEMGFVALSALNSKAGADANGMNYMFPDYQEAEAQSEAWTGWFAKLKPLGLSDPHQASAASDPQAPSPSSLACALSSRRGLAASPNPKGCYGP